MDGVQRAGRAHAYENPRPEVQALVPASARRVLDLGCASGALGAGLKARGDVFVVGVERDPEYAADAGERLDEVVVADVEELAGRASELGTFDVVVAADVLEHLVDPWSALRAYAALVEPGGSVVVSLPNVRNWETFWELGRHGRWPTRSQGIFDRTHLRWFTLRDAWDLVEQAGLAVERVQRVPRPGSSARWLALPGLRALLTFQHVLVARRR
jgi:methionine biosynthesis protein MetW